MYETIEEHSHLVFRSLQQFWQHRWKYGTGKLVANRRWFHVWENTAQNTACKWLQICIIFRLHTNSRNSRISIHSNHFCFHFLNIWFVKVNCKLYELWKLPHVPLSSICQCLSVQENECLSGCQWAETWITTALDFVACVILPGREASAMN